MKDSNLDDILNGTLDDIGRVLDMCWIIFNASQKDDEDLYSLNLQCPWRIRQGNSILLTNYDIYEPTTEDKECADTTENYSEEWDATKEYLFDEKIRNIQLKGLKVENVKLTETYDLIISFSDGFIFECFINKMNGESWRFFKKKKGYEHLVITKGQIEK